MAQRKGQHLFNKIAENHKLSDHKCNMNKGGDTYPYVNLHQILFYMSDEEFDKIMESNHDKQ